MNDYFKYFGIDSEYTKAYPNNMIKNNNAHNSNIPKDLFGINNQMIQKKNDSENENCGLYNLNEGFLRGNMFPNLYDPYKNEKITNIIVPSQKDEELLEIQKLGFALKDINLYLDVYPDNTCLIDLYNKYLLQKNNLLRSYEIKYGPITTSSEALNKVPWAWDTSKWPWEGEK